MINMKQIRQKYPQYNDLSDQQLSDALYQKYYSDMPKQDFYSKIGMSNAAKKQPRESLLSKIGKGAEEFGLGALQSGAEAGRAIHQLGAGVLNKLFGTNLQTPEGSFFVGPAAGMEKTLPAKAGEMAGTIASAAIPGAAVGRLTEAAPLLTRLLGYGGAAAATQPGGVAPRIEAGLLGAGGGAADYMTGILRKLPAYVSPKSLGKLIEKTAENQKKIGSNLYKEAFSNTKDVVPQISENTQQAFKNLLSVKPGRASLLRSVKRFNADQTPENLHTLKSDLGKVLQKLDEKSAKSGLTGNELDKKSYLKDSIAGVENDLENTMYRVSPENYDKYQEAQKHWKENVIPFRNYPAIRRLLGPEREISPRLRTELMKESLGDAGSAAKLRDLMKLQRSGFAVPSNIGQGLSRVWPYGIGAVGGYGLYRGIKDAIGE